MDNLPPSIVLLQIFEAGLHWYWTLGTSLTITREYDLRTKAVIIDVHSSSCAERGRWTDVVTARNAVSRYSATNPLSSHLGQKKLNHIWGFCMNTDTFNWFFTPNNIRLGWETNCPLKKLDFLKSRLSFSDINFRQLFRFLPFCGTHQSNSSSSLTELISKNHQLQANFSFLSFSTM